MKTSSSAYAGAPVITAARAALELEMRAAAAKLAAAAEWGETNRALFDGDAALGAETGLPVAGPGAPLVAEFAVVQLATVLGLSQHAGRALVGDALELKHRLPRTWDRVVACEVTAWRARRLAEHTRLLSREAAAWVDAHLAPFLHGLTWAQQERTIAEAIDRFQPDLAEQRREEAADGRHVTIDHDGEAFTGQSHLRATLDTADALDLDHAVSARAEHLRDLGSTDTLDVRRAQALGELARDDLVLDLEADGRTERPDGAPRRQAVLYLHLDPTGERGWLEQAGRPVPHCRDDP